MTAKHLTNDMKTLGIEFYEAVRKMRTAQKAYFKTRGFDVLAESKKLEKQVDKMLEEYGTLNLFDKPEKTEEAK